MDCAHCRELYTPVESDPDSVKKTRQLVFDWIGDILATTKPQAFLQ